MCYASVYLQDKVNLAYLYKHVLPARLQIIFLIGRSNDRPRQKVVGHVSLLVGESNVHVY